jgi:hypothetical protein
MWRAFEVSDNEPFVWTGGNGLTAHTGSSNTSDHAEGNGFYEAAPTAGVSHNSLASAITVRLLRHGAYWEVSVSAAETVHYTVFSGQSSVLFHPCLPECPLLAVLPCRHILAPNQEAAFKLGLPCVPKLEIGGISKIPLVYPLKLTFEGVDTIHGELCAVLTTPVKPLFSGAIEKAKLGESLIKQEDDEPPLSIITEVVIRNRSKQDYAFDRIVVYPETIDIFEKTGRLSGGLVLIDYLDSGEIRMQTQNSAPLGYQLVTKGTKDDAGARFFRQGAGFIKDLTNIKVS